MTDVLAQRFIQKIFEALKVAESERSTCSFAFSKTKPMQDEHFKPVLEWWGKAEKGQWLGRTESDVSQYVPVEAIITGGQNLDLCGFPYETVEILPPEEFIAHYLHEKNVISGRIENILGRISAAMNQEGAQ